MGGVVTGVCRGVLDVCATAVTALGLTRSSHAPHRILATRRARAWPCCWQTAPTTTGCTCGKVSAKPCDHASCACRSCSTFPFKVVPLGTVSDASLASAFVVTSVPHPTHTCTPHSCGAGSQADPHWHVPGDLLRCRLARAGGVRPAQVLVSAYAHVAHASYRPSNSVDRCAYRGTCCSTCLSRSQRS